MKDDDLLDDGLARPAPISSADEEKKKIRHPYFSTASLMCMWIVFLIYIYPHLHQKLGITGLDGLVGFDDWDLVQETVMIPGTLFALFLQSVASRRNERMTVYRAALFLAIPTCSLIIVLVSILFASSR